MIAIGFTATTLGVDGHIIRIEADSSAGTPAFTIIGLPDRALSESRERVRAAIFHSGMAFPAGKVLVNLAPADIHKTGMGFDLPLALALLAIDEQIKREALREFLSVGELALDGMVRPVSGILPMMIGAGKYGHTRVIVARGNAAEAALVTGLEVYAVDHISDAVAVILGRGARHRYQPQALPRRTAHTGDFADVRGQLLAKRACEIAAAGGHHLRLIGPPGCGKTMLARRFPSILPQMNEAEILTATAIASAAGQADLGAGLCTDRPFRAPHHTATAIALCGGGRIPKPGEISLAHHGVLFLDEFAEFSRAAIETLRQPLEEGRIVISRSSGAMTYPARFQLLVAMNPCPCGMRGERHADCRCDDAAVARYTGRLSGPLLDRIDLHVRVHRLDIGEMAQYTPGESSASIRKRVEAAHERRARRSAGENLSAGVSAERDALQLLRTLGDRARISARVYARLLRVARTIADLAGDETIGVDAVSEAFSYR